MNNTVNIIGAGLAGCEAAWQLAKRGINVTLYEMRPKKMSPAHLTGKFSELVCSNSFRSNSMQNAAGILKEELRLLDSLIIEAADATSVPAGGALAVDRDDFSEYITQKILSNSLIKVVYEEVINIPLGYTIIATGPLTSDLLSNSIKDFVKDEYLYFFDAAAPIIAADSIDYNKVYLKSRYDKGEAAYLNCPMTKDEYTNWYNELINAECVIPKDYELEVFEGCMPFEEIARRGFQTLLFGPMKPVGLQTPDGERPFAVVQLRQDNAVKTLYNIVGFQTHLKFGEQDRIIKLIPGLKDAEIVRYGVMHRNTFINSPKIINATYQCKLRNDLFFAGQLTGVEGYVESIGSGLVAGVNMSKLIKGEELIEFPRTTSLGSSSYYIANCVSGFQPMNTNFGIFEDLGYKHKKKERKELYGKRAVNAILSIRGDICE